VRVRRKLETAPTRERPERSGRREVEQRFGRDPARSSKLGTRPEHRRARTRICEHDRAAGKDDAERECESIEVGTHGEQHTIARSKALGLQSPRNGEDATAQLRVAHRCAVRRHGGGIRGALARVEHGGQEVNAHERRTTRLA
jgi:hypothetical protein